GRAAGERPHRGGRGGAGPRVTRVAGFGERTPGQGVERRRAGDSPVPEGSPRLLRAWPCPPGARCRRGFAGSGEGGRVEPAEGSNYAALVGGGPGPCRPATGSPGHATGGGQAEARRW